MKARAALAARSIGAHGDSSTGCCFPVTYPYTRGERERERGEGKSESPADDSLDFPVKRHRRCLSYVRESSPGRRRRRSSRQRTARRRLLAGGGQRLVSRQESARTRGRLCRGYSCPRAGRRGRAARLRQRHEVLSPGNSADLWMHFFVQDRVCILYVCDSLETVRKDL